MTFFFVLFSLTAAAQAVDTAALKSTVFERIAKEMGGFTPDTSAAPNDKITQTINELRRLRGGFNINEAIAFKLEEDRQKGEMPADRQAELAAFFTTGNGRRWLDNAVTWIYRNRFTYKELRQLVKFYRTEAGQKMAEDFPVIMLQSLAAAELLKKGFEEKAKQKPQR